MKYLATFKENIETSTGKLKPLCVSTGIISKSCGPRSSSFGISFIFLVLSQAVFVLYKAQSNKNQNWR